MLPGSNEKLTKASNASLVTVSDTMKALRELGLVQKIDGNHVLVFSREPVL
jgi:Fe2+ or Zn2+ uptake regulation protein